jgi:hypothetical protein
MKKFLFALLSVCLMGTAIANEITLAKRTNKIKLQQVDLRFAGIGYVAKAVGSFNFERTHQTPKTVKLKMKYYVMTEVCVANTDCEQTMMKPVKTRKTITLKWDNTLAEGEKETFGIDVIQVDEDTKDLDVIMFLNGATKAAKYQKLFGNYLFKM